MKRRIRANKLFSHLSTPASGRICGLIEKGKLFPRRDFQRARMRSSIFRGFCLPETARARE
jgi:hypothetical protein